MAGSLNRVMLIGNVCADAEIRRNQEGKPIANLRIATNETWRDKNTGERKEKAEYHSVVVFNEGICKVIEQYVKKGAKLFIEGSLQTRRWQDQSGNDRYSTEIVLSAFNGNLTMLDSGGSRDGGNSQSQDRKQQSSKQDDFDSYGNSHDDLSDDLPF
jgi:single-strand DNA-binding protein